MNLVAPHILPVNNTEYQLDHDYTASALGRWITVKRGYVTDGASIPRIFWRLVGHPFQGLVLPAAIIHDALYQAEAVPRPEADKLFYALLLANEVGKWKAWAMYKAVRIGGAAAWNRHDPSDVELTKKFVVVK